jgi:hypothetical protein
MLTQRQKDAWMQNEIDKTHAAWCVIGSLLAAGFIIGLTLIYQGGVNENTKGHVVTQDTQRP